VPVIHHDFTALLPGPTAIRVPVSHLTLHQFLGLQPQVMLNGPRSNEFAVARAADARAMRRVVAEEHARLRADRYAGGGPSSPTAVPAAARRSPLHRSRSMEPRPQPTAASATSDDVHERAPRHFGFSEGSAGAGSAGTGSAGGGASGNGGSDAASTASSGSAAAAAASSSAVNGSGGGGGGIPPLGPAALASGVPQPPPSSSTPPSGLTFYFGLRDTFTTLADLLRRMPASVGFNAEIKYPTAEEAAMLGLRPLERNAYVDRILDVVLGQGGAGSRPLMFSSFDPDVCLLLARKQAAHPVFMLTEGGTADPPFTDPRCNSLAAAVAFARGAGLFGIVTHAAPLLAAPSLIRLVQEEAGLVLCSYGRVNNDIEAVLLQQRAGIGAVIVDHVAHVTRTLRASASGVAAEGAVGQ
jgi:glycerophosphoryl diester phosphodiesterase